MNEHRAGSYPLMDYTQQIQAASGRPLADITLEAAAAGEISAADLRVSAATLRAQADIAEAGGYRQLAANLRRAAELTAVPNTELLRMYETLRPHRATYVELQDLAARLETEYAAVETAGFVREAAEVYRVRNLLRQS
jgi:propanediol dehydratase small subunit